MSEYSSLVAQLVPVAKAAAIFGSAVQTGMTVATSFMFIPAILEAPADVAAKQWKRVYDFGKANAPPFAVVTALCFGFLALQAPKVSSITAPAILYSVAALAIPSIVPYTLAFMLPTNKKLMGKATKSNDLSDAEVRQLIRKWRGFNNGRAVLVGTGTILGIIAALQ